MDVNREKALDLAVSQIERQFGKGAIMKLGDGGVPKDQPIVSTGSLGLDIARHTTDDERDIETERGR